MELYEQNQLLKKRILETLKFKSDLFSNAVLFAFYDTHMDHAPIDTHDGYKKMEVMTWHLMQNSNNVEKWFIDSYFDIGGKSDYENLQKRYNNQINYLETIDRARAYMSDLKMNKHIPLRDRILNEISPYHETIRIEHVVWIMSRDWQMLSSEIGQILKIDYDTTMKYWSSFIHRNSTENQKFEACQNILNVDQLYEKNNLFARASDAK